MINCAFCQIIAKEKKSVIVYEDLLFIGILDKRPLFLGHCLLLPKQHIETIYNLSGELGQQLFPRVKLLAKGIESGMRAQGSFIAINNRISQSIPHLHVHIVPRNKKDGLKGFFWPRHQYHDDKQMLEIKNKIKAFL